MIIGTVVKITSTVVIDPPGTIDSVKIDIYNPAETKIVDDKDMIAGVEEGDYYYLFQSDVSGAAGIYYAITKANSGTFTAKAKAIFKLEEF